MVGIAKPKPPPTPRVARMPDPESPGVLEARRRKTGKAREREGRESTILTENLVRSIGKAGA